MKMHGATSRTGNIRIDRFSPPAGLTPYVTQCYYFRCDDLDLKEIQPAALGHLVFNIYGNGTMRFRSGIEADILPANIFGPCTAAAEYHISGPMANFGLALTPAGFVALTGESAHIYADRLADASSILGPEVMSLTDRLRSIAQISGEPDFAAMIDLIGEFLSEKLQQIPDDHFILIDRVGAWINSSLSPDVDVLYESLGKSRNTATRLVSHYFGATPKALMRKYRALRTATMLIDDATTESQRAEIQSHFYDQPHMIREIRHFTGRTPGTLDSDDAKILRVWLNKENYRDLKPVSD
jgi:AraC-like DNA-binding protein